MLHFKKSQKGRTMLEMLMVLAMIGIMALGGYAGIRYGMSVLNSWTVQQQVTDLSKGVESLYAWESDYRNLSMSGSRGICENIMLGTQKCNYENFTFTSPWGSTIEVTKGQSNSSYKIIYSNVPKIVCNQLQDMKWTGVYLQTESCDSAPLNLVFSAEKSDGSCTEPCRGEQVCRSGICVCANGGIGEQCIVPNKCPGMSCSGECNTGECKDNRCVQKPNGTVCSSGVCRWGSCESNVTEPSEETVTEEETTTIEKECGSNSIRVNGTCYSCTQTASIYAGNLSELEGCSNRSIGCGTTGSIDCKSYLKSCPSGYYLTQSRPGSYVSCNSGEIEILSKYKDDYTPDGCCALAEETTELIPDECLINSYNGICYPCNYPGDMGGVGGVDRNQCESVCPNREIVGAGNCVPKCSSSRPLRIGTEAQCLSCDTTEVVYDESGTCLTKCPNRSKNGDYCVLKTSCGTNAIMDSYGQCRSCNSGQTISLSPDRLNQCAQCPDRTLVGNQCKVKCTGATPVGTSGQCFSCDSPEGIQASATECAKCSNRKMSGQYCILSVCPADKPVMNSSGDCFSCDTEGRIWGSKNCVASCPNRYEENGNCYKKCLPNEPLKDSSNKCYACDTPVAVFVGKGGACSSICSGRHLNVDYCVLGVGPEDTINTATIGTATINTATTDTATISTGTIDTATTDTATISTGTISTGTISTGTINTATISTGTISTGTISTGTINTATISTGTINTARP